jgi:hypothetical protein
MQSKVLSVTKAEQEFFEEMSIVAINWNEPSPNGHVTVTDAQGRILAVVTKNYSSLHFPEPLKAKHLRFSGLDSGIIQAYSRGTSTSGH